MYCDCVVKHPHFYNNLQKSVELLEKLDKSKVEERAKYVLGAYTSLRVFNIIKVRSFSGRTRERKLTII
jgi:hypothetical protein